MAIDPLPPPPSLLDLHVWRRDVLDDLYAAQSALTWIDGELEAREAKRGYRRVPIAELRSLLQERKRLTVSEAGLALGGSTGQMRYKLQELVDQGTAKKVRGAFEFVPVEERKPLKAPHKRGAGPRLTTADAVPYTGREATAELRRRGVLSQPSEKARKVRARAK